MKTKIDKNFTRNTDKVKEALKEFKICFTENDLINQFYEKAGLDNPGNGKVYLCNVTGFEDNWYTTVSFEIEMLISYYDEIRELHFYCDEDLTISTNKDLCKCIIYKQI